MKTKLILTMAAVVICATLIVGGTLAYFTSTDSATNEFTVGNVTIDLTETLWSSSSGYQPSGARSLVAPSGGGGEDLAEAFVPGRVIPKNPTVTVASGSEPCYVRVSVAMPTDLVNIVTYSLNDGWSLVGTDTTTTSGTTVRTYKYIDQDASDDAAMEAGDSATLFDDVTIDEEATEEDLADFDMVVKALRFKLRHY